MPKGRVGHIFNLFITANSWVPQEVLQLSGVDLQV